MTAILAQLVVPVRGPLYRSLLNITDFAISACSLTEGKSISKTTGITFGVGGTFDLSEAVHAGLDFGVSVSFTETTSQTTSETCVASGDDNKPCVCGLQFKISQQEARGHFHRSDNCGFKSNEEDFDVTSPVLIDGKPRTQWRVCKAAASTCDKMADSPACADGL